MSINIIISNSKENLDAMLAVNIAATRVLLRGTRNYQEARGGLG